MKTNECAINMRTNIFFRKYLLDINWHLEMIDLQPNK